MQVSSSNMTKTVLSAILTMSLGFSLSVRADDSEQIKSSLMSRMTSSTGSFISTGIGALLSPNFNTVEVTLQSILVFLERMAITPTHSSLTRSTSIVLMIGQL